MILPTHVCRHFRGHRHLPTCRHCQQKFADRPQSAADSLYSLMPYKPPSGSDSIHWFSLINVDYCRSAQVVCWWQTPIPMWHEVFQDFLPLLPILMLMNGIAASIECFCDAHSHAPIFLFSSMSTYDHSSYIYSLSILRWHLMQLIILAISHICNKNNDGWILASFNVMENYIILIRSKRKREIR